MGKSVFSFAGLDSWFLGKKRKKGSGHTSHKKKKEGEPLTRHAACSIEREEKKERKAPIITHTKVSNTRFLLINLHGMPL